MNPAAMQAFMQRPKKKKSSKLFCLQIDSLRVTSPKPKLQAMMAGEVPTPAVTAPTKLKIKINFSISAGEA